MPRKSTATKSTSLPEEAQAAIVAIAEKAIAGARQSTGTINRMKEMGVSFERDNTDDVAKGVLGSRKRHDETINLVRDILVPMLDVSNRAAIAKAIDERFKRGPRA